MVFADTEEITAETLPEEILLRGVAAQPPSGETTDITVPHTIDFKSAKKEFERRYIERSLEQSGGNVTRAAEILGMHRQSLQHKIKELGLSKKFVVDD